MNFDIVTSPQPLSNKELMELFQKYKNGDEEARNKLIFYNTRLVVHLAKKFDNTGIELSELFSIGSVGLVKAVDTFDISKNIKFATYASTCINNEILMFLRRNKKHSGMTSLDAPLSIDDEGGETTLHTCLNDSNMDIVDNYEQKESIHEIKILVEQLPKREKEIIYLYFGFYGDKQYNQREIAQKMNISQSYISRLLVRILKKLKKQMQNLDKNDILKNAKISEKKKSEEQKELLEFDFDEVETPVFSEEKVSEEEQTEEKVSEEQIEEKVSEEEQIEEKVSKEEQMEEKVSKEEQIEEKVSEEVLNIINDDYIKTLQLLKIPTYTEMLSSFTPKEAVIIALRLGFANWKPYETEELAKFLKVDTKEIRDIVFKFFDLYKNNLQQFFYRITEEPKDKTLALVKTNSNE